MRSILVPMRQSASHGNGADRGGHLTHVDDLTSLPSEKDDLIARRQGTSVTSMVIMSMQTEPTIGARRPPTST